jgi:hypothetical protein
VDPLVVQSVLEVEVLSDTSVSDASDTKMRHGRQSRHETQASETQVSEQSGSFGGRAVDRPLSQWNVKVQVEVIVEV